MDELPESNRRTALKTIGAGMIGGALLTGSATAQRNNYGNGNGVGAFLNEDALFKNQPIWDRGVADKTGQSQVDVMVGTPTSVDIPEDMVPPGVEAPEELPMAFSPHAVEVSPGTEVTWTWVTDHHSVTSFNASASTPRDHGQLFDYHGHLDDTFSHTFDEVGNHLYFCIPHGTPYPFEDPLLGREVENLFGMRGAVIVSDE